MSTEKINPPFADIKSATLSYQVQLNLTTIMCICDKCIHHDTPTGEELEHLFWSIRTLAESTRMKYEFIQHNPEFLD